MSVTIEDCRLRLFVILFDRREQARWGPKRLTVIEQREIADVKRRQAAWRLGFDDHGDGAAFHTFAKADATSAGKARVSETFQHAAVDCTTGAI